MFKRKGQSTVEYALIIAVVVAGLLLMQYYIRRGYAGKLKSSSDDIGEQYDPTTYNANFNINESSQTNEVVANRQKTKTYSADKVENKTGRETVGAWAPGQDLYQQ